MEKNDLRVIKTKRSLTTAMFSLLERQDFHSITVNDICAEAMVSRSTFYTYFDDKYALLGYCVKSLHDNLFPNVQELTINERIKDVLERVKDNAKPFKNLLMVSFDEELFSRMRQSFSNEISRIFKESPEKFSMISGPPEIVATFYASGLTSAIVLWVKNNMDHPIEEMAECLTALLPGGNMQSGFLGKLI